MKSIGTVHRLCLTERDFDPMPFEVDFTGFVSNTVAVKWMETLRIALMREHFGAVSMEARENLSVIAETAIRYRSPIRFGDVIQGKAWVAKVTSGKWLVQYEFVDRKSGRVAISSEQTGAFLSADTFLPVRVPQQVISIFTNKQGGV